MECGKVTGCHLNELGSSKNGGARAKGQQHSTQMQCDESVEWQCKVMRLNTTTTVAHTCHIFERDFLMRWACHGDGGQQVRRDERGDVEGGGGET
jgi:hypothetical protein